MLGNPAPRSQGGLKRAWEQDERDKPRLSNEPDRKRRRDEAYAPAPSQVLDVQCLRLPRVS